MNIDVIFVTLMTNVFYCIACLLLLLYILCVYLIKKKDKKLNIRFHLFYFTIINNIIKNNIIKCLINVHYIKVREQVYH